MLKKMSTTITIIIAAVVTVCILVLFLVSTSNIKKNLQESAEATLTTSISSKKQTISAFMEECETILGAFSVGNDLREFLLDLDSEEKKEAALDGRGAGKRILYAGTLEQQ